MSWRVEGIDRASCVAKVEDAAEAGADLGQLAGGVARLEGEGKTAVVVAVDGAAAGVLALRDEPRSDAAAGVAALVRLGIRSVTLTGDDARTGAALAKGLGLDVEAELLPDDKLREIGALRAVGTVVSPTASRLDFRCELASRPGRHPGTWLSQELARGVHQHGGGHFLGWTT